MFILMFIITNKDFSKGIISLNFYGEVVPCNLLRFEIYCNIYTSEHPLEMKSKE